MAGELKPEREEPWLFEQLEWGGVDGAPSQRALRGDWLWGKRHPSLTPPSWNVHRAETHTTAGTEHLLLV